MGKTLSIIIGIASTAAGIFLAIKWFKEIAFMAKCTLPFLLVLIGVIALASGIAETIDTRRFKD